MTNKLYAFHTSRNSTKLSKLYEILKRILSPSEIASPPTASRVIIIHFSRPLVAKRNSSNSLFSHLRLNVASASMSSWNVPYLTVPQWGKCRPWNIFEICQIWSKMAKIGQKRPFLGSFLEIGPEKPPKSPPSHPLYLFSGQKRSF